MRSVSSCRVLNDVQNVIQNCWPIFAEIVTWSFMLLLSSENWLCYYNRQATDLHMCEDRGSVKLWVWGILNFGFGREVLSWEFESGPVQIPIFKEKVIHSYSDLVQFLLKLPDLFFKIFLNLSQFWLRFRKSLKIDPFKYQILHKSKGYWYTRRLLLLTHVCSTSP